ncbi:Transposase IS200 like protein [Pseudoalteromonas sp. P1-9]|uniref:IS200/IS605 family transposase n=1 Tax=Pseudoalteromonas sp. P1-9 TaxID=1710354 RepID=UPI0006D60E32|nr:IS200/IS605 family transposase [Pseudoalteromonas sp. P1-9]KPV94062.1 Transposase IS200 like protein [Pseudoalteromonas sp. P1-9]
MEYETKSHCKYLIALHLILVVKYRKQLLCGALGQFVKVSIVELSKTSDFAVEEIEIDKDHIHILMTISPKYSISQHVRNIKQATNQRIWSFAPSLKRQFWKEKTFWSDGYFTCSVGNASAETIRKYIQEQG